MPIYTPIRLSHLLRHAAPGSIVRSSDDNLMVLMDTRYWVKNNGSPIGEAVPRSRIVSCYIADGKDLHFPPIASLNSKKVAMPRDSVLPALPFPGWTSCSSCHRMYRNPWYMDETNNNIESPRCVNKKCSGGVLEQLPWVMIHEHGYMDEVPWHFLAHKHKSVKNCKDESNLYFFRKNRVITIKCTCSDKAKESLPENELTAKARFSGYKKMQQQPWLRKNLPAEANEINPITVEVGNSSIYEPVTDNALVIPPESRQIKNSVASKLRGLDLFDKLERSKIGAPLRYKSKLNSAARHLGCTINELQDAIHEIKTDSSEQECESLSDGSLRELEYQALLTEIHDFDEDEDFVTLHKSKQWKKLLDSKQYSNSDVRIIDFIDRVVAVKRLRKIEVFKGFYRNKKKRENELDDDYLIPPDTEGRQGWFPAIELFGEGVFITLDENILSKWEKLPEVQQRCKVIQSRWNESSLNLGQIQVTARFLLIHTLSHLMIRQLESEVGYPAAALNERLFVQEPNNENEAMSGILIYVAVADKVGSLGGLVDIAKPKRLLAMMSNVFNKASWCSLDPVCAEHEGQGPDFLNRAACHGCSLVPDTACDFSNVLLDRVFVKGDSEIPNILDFNWKE